MCMCVCLSVFVCVFVYVGVGGVATKKIWVATKNSTGPLHCHKVALTIVRVKHVQLVVVEKPEKYRI
jgi:hypothetical protein